MIDPFLDWKLAAGALLLMCRGSAPGGRPGKTLFELLFRNGKEIGRISGHEWGIPELALKKALDRSAKAK